MDIQKKVLGKLDELNPELINKLRENDSLIHFTRNFIINIMCSEIRLKLNYDDLQRTFCKKNNIDDE